MGEFLIVAPETDQAGARTLAERLCAAVEQASVSYNGQAIRLTVSIGFAVVEAGTETGDTEGLRHAAAAALAEAKSAGRNRCVVRQFAPPSPAGGNPDKPPPASSPTPDP
jgi:diguanylate cyclase (GGDEF)-like protein